MTHEMKLKLKTLRVGTDVEGEIVVKLSFQKIFWYKSSLFDDIIMSFWQFRNLIAILIKFSFISFHFSSGWRFVNR